MGPKHMRQLVVEFVGCAVLGIGFALLCAYAAGWIGGPR